MHGGNFFCRLGPLYGSRKHINIESFPPFIFKANHFFSNMKYSFVATTLATAAVVAADPISLAVSANGQSLGYLYSKHEGAGFNYFFITNSGGAQSFDYNTSTKQITWPFASYTADTGAMGPYFATGPSVTPLAISIDGSKNINNFNFWSCSNTGDSYNYSINEKIIAINAAGNNTAPFPSCSPVTISVVAAVSSSSSSSTSSAANNTTTTTICTGCASQSSTVTVVAGAAKNAMGAVAGVAGIAALLI